MSICEPAMRRIYHLPRTDTIQRTHGIDWHRFQILIEGLFEYSLSQPNASLRLPRLGIRAPATTAARGLLLNKDVNNTAQRKGTTQPPFGADIVDLVEEMLFQRAACGIRPVLYLSSYIDLECSMLMLLDDAGEARWSAEQTPAEKHVGYHIVTN